MLTRDIRSTPTASARLRDGTVITHRDGVPHLPSDAFDRAGFGRRLAPYLGAALAITALAPLLPGEIDRAWLATAIVLQLVAAAAAISILIAGAPRSIHAAPPVVFAAAAGALLHSVGAQRSTVAVVLLLAVIWTALYSRRSEMLIVIAAGVAVVAAAGFADASSTVAASTLASTMFAIVAVVVGLTTDRLVGGLETEARHHATVIGHALDPFVAYDSDGMIRVWNHKAAATFGWSADEALGRSVWDLLIPPHTRAQLAAALVTGHTHARLTAPARHRDGHTIQCGWAVSSAGRGRLRRYNAFVEDVEERERTQHALRTNEARFRTLFESAPIGMLLASIDGRIGLANDAIARRLGFERTALEGRALDDLMHPDDRGADGLNLGRLVGGRLSNFESERRLLAADGRTMWVQLHATIMQTPDGRSDHLLFQIVDITERRTLHDELRRLADCDSLTGVLNRRAFEREVERHLTSTASGGALFSADLDGFKRVNDKLGHAAGDAVLVAVAHALVAGVGEWGTVGRLGGDEFAVLVDRAGDHATLAAALLDRATKAAAAGPLPVGVSLGVASRLAGSTTRAWLADADAAMYTAKRSCAERVDRMGSDRSTIVVDESLPIDPFTDDAAWQTYVAAAIIDEELAIEAMPIVNLRTRTIDRHELLVRLPGNGGELIQPAAFLSIAEQCGLMGRIDRWMTRRAIEMLARSADTPTSLAINVSGQTIADPEFVTMLERELRRSRVEPGLLTFELTASAMTADLAGTQRFAADVRRLGCLLALEDFGIGPAPFAHLKDVPFDFLNIGAPFVAGCAHDATDQLVIESLVAIAHRLGKLTMAKYAVNHETLTVLRSLGVDYAEGAFVGMPSPLAGAHASLAPAPGA
jgi:diguanylate cyclase (GGDEF)-like protein/PAS domain S-box-containing protein